jgi:hypothetical protein
MVPALVIQGTFSGCCRTVIEADHSRMFTAADRASLGA